MRKAPTLLLDHRIRFFIVSLGHVLLYVTHYARLYSYVAVYLQVWIVSSSYGDNLSCNVDASKRIV